MLFRWAAAWALSFFEFILTFLDLPDTSSATTMLNGITALMNYVFSNIAGIFFFFIPQTTFFYCMDLLFIIWSFVPLYWVCMWILRKIPFLGIK